MDKVSQVMSAKHKGFIFEAREDKVLAGFKYGFENGLGACVISDGTIVRAILLEKHAGLWKETHEVKKIDGDLEEVLDGIQSRQCVRRKELL